MNLKTILTEKFSDKVRNTSAQSSTKQETNIFNFAFCEYFISIFLKWNGSLELSMNFTETELVFSVRFSGTQDDTVSQLFVGMKLVVKQDKCKLDIVRKLIGRELISLDGLHICNRVGNILDAFRKRKRTERLSVRKWRVRAGV